MIKIYKEKEHMWILSQIASATQLQVYWHTQVYTSVGSVEYNVIIK